MHAPYAICLEQWIVTQEFLFQDVENGAKDKELTRKCACFVAHEREA